MAPLNHDLSGVILPCEHFGSDLDGDGKTIDEKLEKQNFQHARQVLCDSWSESVIDGHPVKAEFVDEKSVDMQDDSHIDAVWYQKHVRESQYFLQIFKCTDPEWCRPLRSSLRKILPNGFLPPPTKIKQSKDGLEICSQTDVVAKFMPFFPLLAMNSFRSSNFKEVNMITIAFPWQIILTDIFFQTPYDKYCPSVVKQLKDRTCKVCYLYFSSKKSKLAHMKAIHKNLDTLSCSRIWVTNIVAYRNREALCIVGCEDDSKSAEWIDVEDLEIESDVINNTEHFIEESITMPQITNIQEWIASPWANE